MATEFSAAAPERRAEHHYHSAAECQAAQAVLGASLKGVGADRLLFLPLTEHRKFQLSVVRKLNFAKRAEKRHHFAAGFFTGLIHTVNRSFLLVSKRRHGRAFVSCTAGKFLFP